MPTELDKRANLEKLVEELSAQDMQKLAIFLAGMETGKVLNAVPTDDSDTIPPNKHATLF